MIAILGIPSAFSTWGFAVARHLVATMQPGLEQRWIERADAFEQDAAADLLVCSSFPSRSLRASLSTQPIPIVVFTTSALDAVGHVRPDHAVLRAAVGTIGASIALIGDCRPQKRALFLDASDMMPADTVIHAVAVHLGYDLPSDSVDAVLAAAGPMPIFSPQTFSEAEEGIVTLVLANSVAHLRDPDAPLKSIWPHRVFLAGDRPNEEAPLVAEATGGSRILFYGPYFHLARGPWRAKLTLGFTKELIGLPLKIRALGPDELGEARLRPQQEGIFAAQFNFAVTDAEHPVELQLWTEEGAIEGRIALGQAELSHLGDEQQGS